MDHPPPHSFSRSPVEEVFCQCSLGSGAESLSLTFPRPYSGWPHISDGIRDMIACAGNVSHITGCMLRYTDLFPVVPGIALPGTEDLEHLLSGQCTCSVDTARDEIVLFSMNIAGTAGSVRSIHDRLGTPGWTLIFTLHTERPTGFDSGDHVLRWFDDARAGIHGLFDLIVPEEIVQVLR